MLKICFFFLGENMKVSRQVSWENNKEQNDCWSVSISLLRVQSSSTQWLHKIAKVMCIKSKGYQKQTKKT
jgi:hypothetical protein